MQATAGISSAKHYTTHDFSVLHIFQLLTDSNFSVSISVTVF